MNENIHFSEDDNFFSLLNIIDILCLHVFPLHVGWNVDVYNDLEGLDLA